ncbi:hypothetical protein GCM10027037_03200 [Mucilaginibacter koreensis]
MPLLFLAGETDHIIPAQLNEKSVKGYSKETSVTDFEGFSNRGQVIYGQPGWDEVATYVYEWLESYQSSESKPTVFINNSFLSFINSVGPFLQHGPARLLFFCEYGCDYALVKVI